jgi:hypothetical protein
LLSAIWEGLFQVVTEVLMELGWRALGEPFEKRSHAHRALACMSLVLIGGCLGLIFWLVIPMRLLPIGPAPGASLVLSPLFTGTVMEYYGRWRERRGASRSFAATFWGGALFAFGMASARFLLMR